ncbi:MAG: transcriptional regulator [Frankiales bacterium]|nr:transcriptional regulator [Frankiales bacterium]
MTLRLAGLERAAMDVVWHAQRPVTAREVAAGLADRGLAYTTWLTVLGRLERKGLLQRDKSARAHTYRPTGSRADHVAVLMEQALGQAEDRTAVLQHFARTMSAEDAAALRAALEGR